jgi:hypothetical protein
MQFKLADKVKNIQITTVTISHDLDDPQGTKMYIFHCTSCGSPMFQYSGFIISILPGLSPVKLPSVLRCPNSRCKHNYSFHTIV